MATLHRERVEHALNELLVRIVPEDPNENEDEANQRFEDAYEFALDELTTAGDASLVPDVQHIASLIDRKVSGPNNDQRKSARLHNLLSRLETQSVLDQKWRMLYFLYNLSDNAEAPHEPPPAQDARSFSREPTMPSKRQSVAASSHAIQDAFAKPGLTQLPVNAGSPKAPTSTRPASIAEKPEKRRRPDTAKEQQQANGGHVEKAETGPLEPKTIEYCQNDIIHLPALREIYIARIKPEWLNKAKEESEHRATQARSPEYDPQSEGKKLGPWGSGGKERILTIDQMCEMMEEEREEAIARDLFGFDDDLEFLDGDDVWDQEGPGDYEDWGALHSDWDKY